MIGKMSGTLTRQDVELGIQSPTIHLKNANFDF